VINISINTGTFSDVFKTALVTPHLKRPSLNPEELGNYRPVSNLSFMSKTLERVIAQQLSHYLEQNNLLEPNQSAYRRNHSTETALLKINTNIRQAIGEHQVVLIAMLDLSAAFDTISHDILLRSLSASGIQGTALQWMTSYVRNRTQTVIVMGQRSESRQLNPGVAQGSVLGPLLSPSIQDPSACCSVLMASSTTSTLMTLRSTSPAL
jgi:hypothetical protein